MGSLQKFNAFRSRKLLDSANGQICQNCGADDGTIVCAHSNQMAHGKGKGLKAADCFVAYLCAKCHAWCDQGKGLDPSGNFTEYNKFDMWNKAHIKTLHEMFKQNIVIVK